MMSDTVLLQMRAGHIIQICGFSNNNLDNITSTLYNKQSN